ncbi:MAG: DNA mismatch repair protein MutS, partial [Candidatus Eisenbacteria bacterium]
SLDGATLRHLEVFEPQPGGDAKQTLWHHLNLAATGPGSRRLRRWLQRPQARLEPLRLRHDAVQFWLDAAVERGLLRERLKGFPDVERLAARLAAGRSTPRELAGLRDALLRLPEVRNTFLSLDGAVAEQARAALEAEPEPLEMLRRALADEPPAGSKDGGVIRPGHDRYRDELDDLAHSGKRWIAELEATERERTGISSLKVGFNRVFGYYLEVTRTHLDKVPQEWERRQTLTTAERFVTPALKQRESEVLGAEEKLRAREQELFSQLRDRAATHLPWLQRVADALADLDAVTASAEAAARYGWVRPEITDSDRLFLAGSRHPVVERLLPRGEFVPNDVDLDASRRQIILLTGPNMGGKSTYLRQVAIAVLLAQAGWYVPAARAEIGMVDRLFTRVGAADRLGAGQSTFMVEMSETAEILRAATSRSLVLLDEVGRGTATYDGLALAWAVTEYLADPAGPRPRTLFATHYHELTQLAGRLPRLANAQMLVKEWQGRVVFLHRIEDGAADRSYGIHVAQLAGLPASVLARAREVLHELESERTAEHLESGARAAEPSGRVVPGRAAPPPELPLFAAAEHPLIDSLRAADLNTLTPLGALQLLDEWKRKWGGSK